MGADGFAGKLVVYAKSRACRKTQPDLAFGGAAGRRFDGRRNEGLRKRLLRQMETAHAGELEGAPRLTLQAYRL